MRKLTPVNDSTIEKEKNNTRHKETFLLFIVTKTQMNKSKFVSQFMHVIFSFCFFLCFCFLCVKRTGDVMRKLTPVNDSTIEKEKKHII